jgi:two-component system, sensor histidine kinase RegB
VKIAGAHGGLGRRGLLALVVAATSAMACQAPLDEALEAEQLGEAGELVFELAMERVVEGPNELELWVRDADTHDLVEVELSIDACTSRWGMVWTCSPRSCARATVATRDGAHVRDARALDDPRRRSRRRPVRPSGVRRRRAMILPVSEANPSLQAAWPWLARLRWAVALSLAASLPVGIHYLGLSVDWHIALPALVALVLLDLAFSHALRRGWVLSARLAAISVAVDLVLLATVLSAAGAAANPFSALLLVYVALAASLFETGVTLSLALLSALAFGALFLVPGPSCHPADPAFSSHLYGMWGAFALAAVLVALFSTQARRALAERERELAELRRRAEDSSRFAAIGTLAAGAAHELGTPLGTISVIAAEIAANRVEPEELGRQAEEIVQQVKRCREVLRRMHPSALASAVVQAEVELNTEVARSIEAWRHAHPEVVVEHRAGAPARLAIGDEDLHASVGVLLDNALDATRATGTLRPIVVTSGLSEGRALVVVEDEGTGIDAAIAARIGEPFSSTKEPGEGMGLGLYLVRHLLEQVGGRLEIEPRTCSGTRVRMSFTMQSAVPTTP